MAIIATLSDGPCAKTDCLRAGSLVSVERVLYAAITAMIDKGGAFHLPAVSKFQILFWKRAFLRLFKA